jgi:hypothetical protein
MGVLSLEVKWLGHEADHSPPSNAEVINVWSYTSTPSMSSWCGALLSTKTTLPYLQEQHPLMHCPSDHLIAQFKGPVQYRLGGMLSVVTDFLLQRYQSAILHLLGLSEKSNPKEVEDKVRAKAKAYGRQAAEMMLHPEQVFRGFLVSTLVCQDCLHTSQRVESFLDLSLPVMADKVKCSPV